MIKEKNNDNKLVPEFLNKIFEGLLFIRSSSRNKDGSLNLDIEFSKRFEIACRGFYNRKDLTDQDYNEYFIYLVNIIANDTTNMLEKIQSLKSKKS